MKSSAYLVVLAALLLGACSKSPATTAKLATPVAGLRADEVMAAHSVAAEVIPARQLHQQDAGLQTIDKQMALVASDLDVRMGLLTANKQAKVALAHGPADPVGELDPQVKQQLDANTADLLDHLSQARAAVSDVGGSNDAVAGMPADSVRDGLLASMSRIQDEINQIAQAPHAKAVAQVLDLRARLRLQPLRVSNLGAPTISVRVTH